MRKSEITWSQPLAARRGDVSSGNCFSRRGCSRPGLLLGLFCFAAGLLITPIIILIRGPESVFPAPVAQLFHVVSPPPMHSPPPPSPPPSFSPSPSPALSPPDVDEWASVQQQETDAQDDEAKGAWRSMKRRKKRLKRMMQHMMDPIANFLAPTMGLFGPLRAAGMFGGGMEPTGRFGMMREMEPEEPPSLTLQLGSAGGGDPFEELEQPSTAVTDSLRELFNATEVTLGGEPRGEGRSWNWSSKGTAGEGNVQVFTFP